MNQHGTTVVFRIIVVLMATLFAGRVLAEDLPAIDWSAAGKSGAVESEPPPEKRSADGAGFDCETVTRFSHDHGGLRLDSRENLPAKVKRCSRDGFALEITSPSN